MMFQDLIEEYQIIPAKLPLFIAEKVAWYFSLSTQVQQSIAAIKDEPIPIKVDMSKLTPAKVIAVSKELQYRYNHNNEVLSIQQMLDKGIFVYKKIYDGKSVLRFLQYTGIKVSKALYSCVDLPETWETGLESKKPKVVGVDSELQALLDQADQALCIALLAYLKENPEVIEGLVGQDNSGLGLYQDYYAIYRGYYDSLIALCPDLRQMLKPGQQDWIEVFTGLSTDNPTWRAELAYFSEYHIEGCFYVTMKLYIDNMARREFTLVICGDTVEPVICTTNENGKLDVVHKYNPYDDYKLLGENRQIIDHRFGIFLGDLKAEKFSFRNEQNGLSSVIQQMLVELT